MENKETLEEKVKYISFLHKQNLNGRETDDEIFEAGIKAGIEESYSKKDLKQAFEAGEKHNQWVFSCPDFNEWFNKNKKK